MPGLRLTPTDAVVLAIVDVPADRHDVASDWPQRLAGAWRSESASSVATAVLRSVGPSVAIARRIVRRGDPAGGAVA